MGYEVTITYHPRKDDGTYNYETKEEKVIKFGNGFDEIPLENLAAGIMSQMARRDVWVIDAKICEFVRKEVAFKECKDGKGIILKNRKFSFNQSSQMVSEDVVEVVEQPEVQHPHEMIVQSRQSVDDLYSNPNKPVPVVNKLTPAKPQINQNKVLYHVYFEPDLRYTNEIKRLKLKFMPDKKYPVHQIIPSPTGRLDAQKLAITDDTGRVVEVDEKYFASAGIGLVGDKEYDFSGSSKRGSRGPQLTHERSQSSAVPYDPSMGDGLDDFGADGMDVPMPDIRTLKAKFRS